ncbi:tRNA 2-selenouridine(34) synthase MnmH [Plectonema cf. radiosum LEGE 06105]|uniref:tRNA 2-selenouridine(34) synthase MnmH n=1 Tax=Plectonema cf. radiosum LEGE 06105 TaxID=945769 RepID=A0A8J7F0V5_9CYAN|nr:tRNA 2-selenouridine(34) synthase MnmH [Plectonema radiosum]MBE9212505.1 tRNA 2-selenouridine(34) synthase MnmH [Plectonema cf. radiosum LEGE 06105]
MAASLKYTKEPHKETYSEIIDVRSSREFAEDRIPGAINLPVLNDAERAEVGTIYKQFSPFQARKIGAAIVSKNISKHLKEHFANKEKNYQPLIYCWRGGQRSASLAMVLSQIGWRVTLLEGGYKTYRNYVRQQLDLLPRQLNYKILCGLTGSGKTHILRKMHQRGFQVLDLEALANHRGSLLGQKWLGESGCQPAQKFFESQLLQVLQKFNPDQTVWVESESTKIGEIHLPHSLWEKMKQSSCVEIRLPLDARVEFLLREYPHLINNPDILKTKLEKLKYRCGWTKISQWYRMIDNQDWELFVKDMLEYHYDPTYGKSMQVNFARIEEVVSFADLSDSNINSWLDSLCFYNSCVNSVSGGDIINTYAQKSGL